VTKSPGGARGTAGAADPRYALVFDESLRALREQQDALKEARGHAAQLLVAASVAASFLGALSFAGSGRRPLWATVAAVVAGVAYLALVALCVWIMLPREGWSMTFSATDLLKDYVHADRPTPIGAMQASMALTVETHWEKTQQELSARLRALQVATWLLGAALAAWCCALIGG
jgi:hypothetical protein